MERFLVRTLHAVIFLIILSMLTVSAYGEEGFTPLFNGENLDGWVIMHGTPEAWRVRDGILESNAPPKCWLRTENEYLNYVLRLEWRLASEKANSGLFLCAQDIGEEFPSCIEVQITGKNPAAMFPHPESRRGTNRLYVGGPGQPAGGNGTGMKWRYITDVSSCRSNGHIVNQSNIVDPPMGFIAVQAEIGNVQFRNIEIREIVPPLPEVRWSRGRREGAEAPGRH